MLTILHGNDEFGRSEAIQAIQSYHRQGDPAMADLNTTVLDGTRTTLGELRHHCDSIPFMSATRLVIVHELLHRLFPDAGARGARGETPAKRKAFADELLEYLPHLPPTTHLVLSDNRILSPTNPLLKWAAAQPAPQGQPDVAGRVHLFALPKDADLPKWIARRAQQKGGTIDRGAADLMAALIGADLRLIDQEIDKLLLYNPGETITTEAVQLLVTRAREAGIFDLVDSVGLRQTARALKLLHSMLADLAEPLYLLSMLARQIRILLQVKELGDQGLSKPQIASQLKLHPYVVEKGMNQARRFTMSQLESAHDHLVATDWQIKTGQIDDILALDTLIVNLTQDESLRTG